jgi:hypothetical protein
VAETAVPIATLGVEDPQLCPSPRRPVATPGHGRRGPLPDDIAPEPDPRLSLELEPESRRFGDGAGQPARETGRLERDEERLRAPGEGGEPAKPVGDLGGGRAGSGRRTRRKVDHEDVHRAGGEEHPGDRQALVEGREAGPDDSLDAGSRLAGGRLGGLGRVVERLGRERRRGQRPDHPRSCSTPPRLEGRQSRRHVRGEAGHRTASIEQTFDIVNVISRAAGRVSRP